MITSGRRQVRFATVRDVADECNVELTLVSRHGRATFAAGRAALRADVVTSGAALDEILEDLASLIVRDPDLDRSTSWGPEHHALVLSLCLEVARWVHGVHGTWASKERIVPVPPSEYEAWVTGETREVWASGHATSVGRYSARRGISGFAFTCGALGA